MPPLAAGTLEPGAPDWPAGGGKDTAAFDRSSGRVGRAGARPPLGRECALRAVIGRRAGAGRALSRGSAERGSGRRGSPRACPWAAEGRPRRPGARVARTCLVCQGLGEQLCRSAPEDAEPAWAAELQAHLAGGKDVDFQVETLVLLDLKMHIPEMTEGPRGIYQKERSLSPSGKIESLSQFSAGAREAV